MLIVDKLQGIGKNKQDKELEKSRRNKHLTCRNPHCEDMLDAYPKILLGVGCHRAVPIPKAARFIQAMQLSVSCLLCPTCASQKPSVFLADLL